MSWQVLVLLALCQSALGEICIFKGANDSLLLLSPSRYFFVQGDFAKGYFRFHICPTILSDGFYVKTSPGRKFINKYHEVLLKNTTNNVYELGYLSKANDCDYEYSNITIKLHCNTTADKEVLTRTLINNCTAELNVQLSCQTEMHYPTQNQDTCFHTRDENGRTYDLTPLHSPGGRYIESSYGVKYWVTFCDVLQKNPLPFCNKFMGCFMEERLNGSLHLSKMITTMSTIDLLYVSSYASSHPLCLRFVCSVDNNKVEEEQRSQGCLYRKIIPTIHACSIESRTGDPLLCSFSSEENVIHMGLAALVNQNGYYNGTLNDNLSFKINICNGLGNTTCGNHSGHAVGVCITDHRTNETFVAGEIPGTLIYDGDVVYKYHTNRTCSHRPVPIETILRIKCGTRNDMVPSITLVERDCVYEFQMTSPLACPNRPSCRKIPTNGENIFFTLENLMERLDYQNRALQFHHQDDYITLDPCGFIEEYNADYQFVIKDKSGGLKNYGRVSNITWDWHEGISMTMQGQPVPSCNQTQVVVIFTCDIMYPEDYSVHLSKTSECNAYYTIGTVDACPYYGRVYDCSDGGMEVFKKYKNPIVYVGDSLFVLNICHDYIYIKKRDTHEEKAKLSPSNAKVIHRPEGDVILEYYSTDSSISPPVIRINFICYTDTDIFGTREFVTKNPEGTYIFNWRSSYICSLIYYKLSHHLALDPQDGSVYDLSRTRFEHDLQLEENKFLAWALERIVSIKECSPLAAACILSHDPVKNVTTGTTIGNQRHTAIQFTSRNKLNTYLDGGERCFENDHKTTYNTKIHMRCLKSDNHHDEKMQYYGMEGKCTHVILWETPVACPISNPHYHDCIFLLYLDMIDLRHLAMENTFYHTFPNDYKLMVSFCRPLLDTRCDKGSPICILDENEHSILGRVVNKKSKHAVLGNEYELHYTYESGYQISISFDCGSNVSMTEVKVDPNNNSSIKIIKHLKHIECTPPKCLVIKTPLGIVDLNPLVGKKKIYQTLFGPWEFNYYCKNNGAPSISGKITDENEFKVRTLGSLISEPQVVNNLWIKLVYKMEKTCDGGPTTSTIYLQCSPRKELDNMRAMGKIDPCHYVFLMETYHACPYGNYSALSFDLKDFYEAFMLKDLRTNFRMENQYNSFEPLFKIDITHPFKRHIEEDKQKNETTSNVIFTPEDHIAVPMGYARDCHLYVPGHELYDLRPLRKSEDEEPYLIHLEDGQLLMFNICGVVTTHKDCHDHGACLLNRDKSIGIGLGEGVLMYRNGLSLEMRYPPTILGCSGTYLVIDFICDLSSQEGPKFVSKDYCTYKLRWRTPTACPHTPLLSCSDFYWKDYGKMVKFLPYDDNSNSSQSDIPHPCHLMLHPQGYQSLDNPYIGSAGLQITNFDIKNDTFVAEIDSQEPCPDHNTTNYKYRILEKCYTKEKASKSQTTEFFEISTNDSCVRQWSRALPCSTDEKEEIPGISCYIHDKYTGTVLDITSRADKSIIKFDQEYTICNHNTLRTTESGPIKNKKGSIRTLQSSTYIRGFGSLGISNHTSSFSKLLLMCESELFYLPEYAKHQEPFFCDSRARANCDLMWHGAWHHIISEKRLYVIKEESYEIHISPCYDATKLGKNCAVCRLDGDHVTSYGQVETRSSFHNNKGAFFAYSEGDVCDADHSRKYSSRIHVVCYHGSKRNEQIKMLKSDDPCTKVFIWISWCRRNMEVENNPLKHFNIPTIGMYNPDLRGLIHRGESYIEGKKNADQTYELNLLPGTDCHYGGVCLHTTGLGDISYGRLTDLSRKNSSIILHFETGNLTSQRRSSTVEVICDLFKPRGQLEILNTTNSTHADLRLYSPNLCEETYELPKCVFFDPKSSLFYDLRELNMAPERISPIDKYKGRFWINLCNPDSVQNSQCGLSNPAMCVQYQDKSYSVGSRNSPLSVKISNDGVKMEFESNLPCYGDTSIVYLTISCSIHEEPPVIKKDFRLCFIDILWKTPQACPKTLKKFGYKEKVNNNTSYMDSLDLGGLKMDNITNTYFLGDEKIVLVGLGDPSTFNCNKNRSTNIVVLECNSINPIPKRPVLMHVSDYGCTVTWSIYSQVVCPDPPPYSDPETTDSPSPPPYSDPETTDSPSSVTESHKLQLDDSSTLLIMILFSVLLVSITVVTGILCYRYRMMAYIRRRMPVIVHYNNDKVSMIRS